MKNWKKNSLFIFAMFYGMTFAVAQTDIKENLAKGEHLVYDLYYNWNFVWAKGGNINILSQMVDYEDGKAIECSMIATTGKLADKIYRVRDTIISYLEPKTLKTLSFRKAAHEGKNYSSVEGAVFTYRDSEIDVYSYKKKPNKPIEEADLTVSGECTDMAGVIHLIRGLDPEEVKKQDVSLMIFDGRKKYDMRLHYVDEEEIKANNNLKYNCIKYTLFIDNKEAFLEEESMSFWISKDNNRLPIQIDTKIKVGTLRGIFKGKK